jgi:phytoene dehydrogenase-like protein
LQSSHSDSGLTDSGLFDALIAGSGPNGLAAAIRLAQAGLRVEVREAEARWGGGLRSAELTLPGFVHDVCSAVHPLAAASPYFQSLPLAAHGLEWVHSPAVVAHPFDDGTAAVLWRSLEETARGLGADARAYENLFAPFVRAGDAFYRDALAPLRMPRHPLLLARFGRHALSTADRLARATFKTPQARALFAGVCAHSNLPLTQGPSSAVGMMLTVAGHTHGWPFPRGGAQQFADALVSLFQSLGGSVRTSAPVRKMSDLAGFRLALLDLSPRALLELDASSSTSAPRLKPGYRKALERFRYGSAVFKMDWALSGPIPWRAEGCRLAATVHLGGSLEEMVASEQSVAEGRSPESPYVLLTQPSLFDPTRAPNGKHTAWAYCHVPLGSEADMSAAIEAQVERFAPGFRSLILKTSALGPRALELRNANLIGGSISGGAPDWGQLLTRPVPKLNPYRTPLPGVFLCSASTPPGSGVHGMCGFHAAESALR